MIRNIKLTIAYDGTDFCGWQNQQDQRTVQGEIENALEQMHKHPVSINGAGRTDSGVHAVGQVANFFTDIDGIPAEKFTPALNSLLPQDVRVINSCEVSQDFHARFSAKARVYRYQFLCRPTLPHENRYNLRISRMPRLDILNAYGRLILGETDCSIFAGAGDMARRAGNSKFRYVSKSYFYVEKETLIFEIQANAFLHNMVRSVAGTFLHYEDLTLETEKLRQIIATGDRSLAGPTLPPQGLFLWQVEYGLP